MAPLRLSKVRKVYPGGVEAVRGFSLDVVEGEFIVLVGPSGSGKSTVLRMIAGLEEITEGEIRIGDRVVNRLHPKDRDIAMVFQDYALYPHMSVAENMSFALRIRKVPKREVQERVQKAAGLLGIADLLKRTPSKLSGGQQQRVALGRAIVREPAAFLFDEPLSNLDAKLRVSMRAEIRAVQRRLGTTSIYVTHDQEEAMTMADRMVVMCDGRVQQVDTPLRVYRHPVNRFVASFIGSPQMNFIEGRVVEGVFHEAANAADCRIALPPQTAAACHGDRDVVLGVRPSAFREAEGPSDGTISIQIRQTEPLGDVTDVRGTTNGGREVVARLPASEDRAHSGEIRLSLDSTRIHLFEPGEFGSAIR